MFLNLKLICLLVFLYKWENNLTVPQEKNKAKWYFCESGISFVSLEGQINAS